VGIEKQILVIDANIISHALTPDQTEAYAQLFKELEQQYRFAVTGFTQFELQRSSDRENRDKIANYITSEMIRVDLSDALMQFSARVTYLYSRHPSTKGHKITEGDIINAALAIIKGAPILTIDSLDYPTPFFQETARRRVEYQSTRGRDVMDTVYILAPDLENAKYCFNEHKA